MITTDDVKHVAKLARLELSDSETEMFSKQLGDILKSLGVEEIPAAGGEFNPELHNAVMHIEDETKNSNTVAEVFQKGYTMNGKVLRHSMVSVAN